MSVTFGFYNSKEGDRRYDAIQMSSIFDGIIQDGILQHVGTAMVVKESEAMIINVGVGRAWFNHTWTLNDALLPLVVPQSEILLNRYDAVVLEVDSREAVRANDIKIIKGTPASNPTKPTMVKTNDRWQYPLAYIYVGAGVTSIRQANITNCVGTSECPFVTAPLDKVEIDDLIAQWQDQWKEFYEKQTTDMEETNKFWKEQWSTWFLAQTEEIQSAYLTWEAQWNLWYSEHTADMEATSTYWKEKWEAWFNEYTSINTAEMADWKQKSETEFREWFDQLQALLDGNTAASLAKKLLELQEQVFLTSSVPTLKTNTRYIRSFMIMNTVLTETCSILRTHPLLTAIWIRSLDVHIPVIFSVTAMAMLSKVGLFLSSNKGGFIK